MLSTSIARLRTVGLVESISSFLLFFVAVPLKHIGDIPEPVTVIGSIHGGLFLLYLLVLLLAVRAPGLPRKVTGLALVSSLLPFPFGFLILDPRLKQIEPQPAPAAQPAPRSAR